MTDTSIPALRTWLAYYEAWTSHDLDKAMSYIADDIVLDSAGATSEAARDTPLDGRSRKGTPLLPNARRRKEEMRMIARGPSPDQVSLQNVHLVSVSHYK
jgi:hypothetical protein